MFIFSLALWDINLQNISQQTKVITFIEEANSAKPGGTVLYLSPNKCRLWVELGGAAVNQTLPSPVKGQWISRHGAVAQEQQESSRGPSGAEQETQRWRRACET